MPPDLVLLPVPDMLSLGALLLPPLLLGLLLPAPEVPAAPEAPDVPAPEVSLEPEEAASDFLAFLCFLVLLCFFGAAPLVSPVDDDAADGAEPPPAAVPDVSPEAPLDDLPEPVMPEPLAPDVPEVPLAPEEDVPLAPDDAPLGVVAELPPLMPLSLLPLLLPVAPDWLDGLDELDGELPVSVDELCAKAIEDTDAITTSDNDRSVDFNAMENSFD